MKRTPSLALIGIMLLALSVIAASTIIAWQQISDPKTTPTAEFAGFTTAVQIGGSFELTNHWGKKVTHETYFGRYIFVYFGYGYCPDFCPTELANMAGVLDHLGNTAKNVQPLFITIDPERDTVKFLADYVGQFHSSFIGLTGNPDQIKSVAENYRVFYRKVEDRGSTEYLMDHSVFLFTVYKQFGGYFFYELLDINNLLFQ